MSPLDASPNSAGALPGARSAHALRMVFSATLFLSASLMFAVQPMFTKMVLPVLGGSPAVWSVAMVFFQGVLLAGYLYAHVLTRLFRLPVAAGLHLALCCLATLALPIAASNIGAPPASGQSVWLLTVFACSVGLPFFALSANGPLLQAWFARTADARAQDPYFLYGASNIGSFVSLLAYPFLIEPLSGLESQSSAWSGGFLLLAAAIAASAALALRNPAAAAPAAPISDAAAHGRAGSYVATAPRFLAWVALGFVPSGLLVSVTAHISTDIAAAPLLWAIPLALFLLTFVIAFRDRKIVLERFLIPAQVWLAGLALATISINILPKWLTLVLHLEMFFVSALVCHRTLYNLRPRSSDLTLFYVAMSLGGVCGGMFSALAAPVLFSSIVEYPVLVVAALFCAPGVWSALRRETVAGFAFPLAVAAILLTAGIALHARAGVLSFLALITCAIVWRTSAARLAVFATSALALVLAAPVVSGQETYRSFFGVHKIWEIGNGAFRVLSHGTTIHGVMRIRNDDGSPYTGKPLPAVYYSYAGPMGEAIASVREAQNGLKTIFAVGQGVGSLACHRREGEKLTYFEIDAEVARIAGDASKFRFMSDCAPDASVVLGDARLTLARASGKASIIVIDAFSSDAIPVHLLTTEAFAVYLDRLEPNGAIVIHITNKTMDLSQIVARVAAAKGLVAYRREDIVPGGADRDLRANSTAVAIARRSADLGPLAGRPYWKKLGADMQSRPWSDDYSTILPAIGAKLFAK
ncbi:MAG: spermidine synthase [Beijerinckiaceae bacterium]